MGRRDLDETSPEGSVDVDVGDQGNTPVGEGEFDHFPDKGAVAVIFWVRGDGRIAQERLGAGGGYLYPAGRAFGAGAVGELVPDVPHRTVLVFVLDFVVRQGRAAGWAPVDEIFALVEEIALIERNENLAHRF